MPLNYSKWDQLELSDDSDIEGHPNVDKRSLIRWKQRDIHEKRDARRHKIDALTAEIACNSVLHPRLLRIRQRIAGAPATALGDLAEDADAGQSHTGLPFFQYLVDRLQSSPSPAAPPTNAQNQPTYDAMILSLLFQIYDTIKVLPQDEQEKAVLDGMATHIAQLSDHSRKLEADLEAELAEQKKHITSDDIHEGWESKVSHPLQPAYNTDPLSVRSSQTRPAPDQECHCGYDVRNQDDDNIRSTQPCLGCCSPSGCQRRRAAGGPTRAHAVPRSLLQPAPLGLCPILCLHTEQSRRRRPRCIRRAPCRRLPGRERFAREICKAMRAPEPASAIL